MLTFDQSFENKNKVVVKRQNSKVYAEDKKTHQYI